MVDMKLRENNKHMLSLIPIMNIKWSLIEISYCWTQSDGMKQDTSDQYDNHVL